jgi:hypothetical protein
MMVDGESFVFMMLGTDETATESYFVVQSGNAKRGPTIEELQQARGELNKAIEYKEGCEG